MHTLRQGKKEEEGAEEDAAVGELHLSRAAPWLPDKLAHSSQGNLFSPVACEHSTEQILPWRESPAEHPWGWAALLWETQPYVQPQLLCWVYIS